MTWLRRRKATQRWVTFSFTVYLPDADLGEGQRRQALDVIHYTFPVDAKGYLTVPLAADTRDILGGEQFGMTVTPGFLARMTVQVRDAGDMGGSDGVGA